MVRGLVNKIKMTKIKMIYFWIIIGHLASMTIALAIQYHSDKSSEEDKKEIIDKGGKDKEEILDNVEKLDTKLDSNQKKLDALTDYIKSSGNNSSVILKKYGITDEQLEIFSKNIDEFSSSKLDQGNAAYYLKEYSEAINLYTQAIKLNPENGLAYLFRAKSKIFSSDQIINNEEQMLLGIKGNSVDIKNPQEFKDIIEDLTFSIKYGFQPDVFNKRGALYLMLGEWKLALSDFTECVLLDPYFAEAYVNQAQAYLFVGMKLIEEGNITKALDYFQKGIDACNQGLKLKPKNQRIYVIRGTTKYNLKDFSGAIADLSFAKSLVINDDSIHYCRGLSYFFNKDFEEAVKDLTIAIKNNPDDYKLYFFRGKAYKFLDIPKESKQDLEKAYKINPNLDNEFPL